MIDIYKTEIAQLKVEMIKSDQNASKQVQNVENETRKEMKYNFNKLTLEYNELSTKYNCMKEQYSSCERDSRAYKHDSTVLVSDIAVLRGELKAQEIQNANTRSVISNIEEDFKRKVSILENKYKSEINQLNKMHETHCVSVADGMSTLEKQWEAEKVTLNSSIETEMLLRRKMELDMKRERKKMELTLSTALNQVHNNNTEDMIDRTMIGNLIVSYIQRRR